VIRNSLAEILVDTRHRLEEIERRIEYREWTGKITDVNFDKGLARVQLDTDAKTGKPFKSPWVPWKEIAMGNIKTHFPVSIGEEVKLVSQSGDLTDAMIDFSIPSNSNQRPHDKGGEAVIQIGATRLLITGDEIRLKAGKIITEGDTHLGGEGGKLVHRKDDKDSDGDLAVESATKVYAV
jgi:hypothetical protein